MVSDSVGMLVRIKWHNDSTSDDVNVFNSNEYALSKVLVFGETVPVVSVLDLLDEQDSGVVEDAVVVVVVDLIQLQTSLK